MLTTPHVTDYLVEAIEARRRAVDPRDLAVADRHVADATQLTAVALAGRC